MPIEGQDDAPAGRRLDRFSHDRHLFHALLNIVYGFMMFEQVYRYDEQTTPGPCLMRGTELAAVQDVLGHASPRSMAVYVELAREEMDRQLQENAL